MNPIELKLFVSRVSAICDEMGVVLRRTAFSPNIKDRLDFSCALFDATGELFAQAAHIPVHLGSMAYAMRGIVGERKWHVGDMLMLNDPYLGGTHLPDVSVIAPVFDSPGEQILGFVANRAHHANLGCDTPGSMAVSSRLAAAGIIIPPTWLLRAGKLQDHGLALPELQGGKLSGDMAAQVGANQVGVARLQALLGKMGSAAFDTAVAAMNEYADRLTDGRDWGPHRGWVQVF